MLLEEGHRGEGRPGGYEGGPLLPGVAAILDGADDRGVRGRAPDPQLLEALDQRCLCVSRRRLGLVPVGLERHDVEGIPLFQRRQRPLLLSRVAIVGTLGVSPQEPGEADDLAARRELGIAPGP